jgi:myo-inositol 2-dehydrogenase/D-chiro-inositol 1-dehydrogenase
VNLLRVGFIGCGRHATKVLYPSLHLARMQLVAVCDLDEAKAARNARWFGAERAYTDHQRMFDAETLDAVLICTGPKTHAQLTLEAIERGLPVFVEKPPALTLAEAVRVREASERAGAPVMVGTMKRHALIYRRLKAITEEPDFGPVSAVQARMGVGWKNGSGFALLLDMGIHYFDLLRYLLGDVAELSFQKYEREGTHISYAILMRFASGAVGTLSLSDEHGWMQPNERVEITGDGEFAVADNLVQLTRYRSDGTTEAWTPGLSIPNDENNSLFLGGFAGELRAFATAVTEGKAVKADIADTCAALQLIHEIEPSEDYQKGPQSFAHWQSENEWLAI